MINTKEFHALIPKVAYEICTSISRQGFCLTLVGGAVRDYLLTGKLSRDLDFEIKHLFSYKEQRWERMLCRLFENLSKEFNMQFSHKGMNVYSVELGEFSLEFSSPRIEEFDELGQGHKNFTPRYISNLGYQEAFKRRDFSINALGIFFGVVGSRDEFTIVDKFDGVNDLENKVLKNIDDDFFSDPVRLLRLIRFKNKLGFKIDEELLKKVSLFDLSFVTHFYILKEFEKSQTLLFFKDLFEICSNSRIKIPSQLSELHFLKDLFQSDSYLKFSIENFIPWVVFNRALSAEDKKKVVIYFGFSQKKLRKYLKRFDELTESDDSQVYSTLELLIGE